MEFPKAVHIANKLTRGEDKIGAIERSAPALSNFPEEKRVQAEPWFGGFVIRRAGFILPDEQAVVDAEMDYDAEVDANRIKGEAARELRELDARLPRFAEDIINAMSATAQGNVDPFIMNIKAAKEAARAKLGG